MSELRGAGFLKSEYPAASGFQEVGGGEGACQWLGDPFKGEIPFQDKCPELWSITRKHSSNGKKLCGSSAWMWRFTIVFSPICLI